MRNVANIQPVSKFIHIGNSVFCFLDLRIFRGKKTVGSKDIFRGTLNMFPAYISYSNTNHTRLSGHDTTQTRKTLQWHKTCKNKKIHIFCSILKYKFVGNKIKKISFFGLYMVGGCANLNIKTLWSYLRAFYSNNTLKCKLGPSFVFYPLI